MKVPDSKELSHTEKESSRKAVYVIYFTVKDEQQQDFYVFYALKGAHLAEFNQLMASGSPDFKKLHEYGEVLFFGKDKPTPDILTIMREKFNFNTDVIDHPEAPASMVIIPPER